jgi:hypothetical protein
MARNRMPADAMLGARRNGCLALLVAAMMPAMTHTACSDLDEGCLKYDCASWCSIWSCAKDGCHGCGPAIGCPDKPPPPPSPPPLPAVPPWDATLNAGLLNIYGTDGFLFVNGQRLHIKGVNWYVASGIEMVANSRCVM